MRRATNIMSHTLKNKMRWLLMLVVMLGIENSYAQTTTAQTASPAKINLAFEKELPGWLKEANVPAAGVAIIEDGKLKYAKIFGELKRGTPSPPAQPANAIFRSEEHTSELQSQSNLVCRLLLEKKKKKKIKTNMRTRER